MAASGFTPISLYYSTTAAAVPTSGNLANGELGLNIADMKLYAKNSAGTVTLLASSGGAAGTVSSVAVSGGTTGLTTSGGPITTSGTITLAGTLATTNGGTNLTSFTSGGVVYASSTSALATGSALTFDGTNLGLAFTPSAWGSNWKAMQFIGNGSVVGRVDTLQLNMILNAFQNGTDFKYLSTGFATRYVQNGGAHQWINAPSGTAGDTVTFTTAMTLDASGNLGIGTTSPAYKLHAVKTGGGILGRFDNADGVADIYGYGLEITRSVAYIKGSGALQLGGANGYNDLVINSSGNVGIGTSSPTQVLDIQKSQAWATLTSTTGTLSSLFKSSNTGGSSYFGRDNSTGGVLGSSAYATVVYGSGAYPMTFHTNDTERMRIVAAGNVGIGTSSPATKLDVNGSITTTGAVQFNGTDASMGTGQIKYITGAGLSIYAKTGSGYDFTLFGAAGNNIMRIPTGTVNLDFPQAGVTFNAYGIGLGGTSPSSGTGITFPATQSASSDANTLDDYEEGTWTPSDGSGAGLSITFILTC